MLHRRFLFVLCLFAGLSCHAAARANPICNSSMSDIRELCLGIEKRVTSVEGGPSNYSIEMNGLVVNGFGPSITATSNGVKIADLTYLSFSSCVRDITTKIIESSLCAAAYGQVAPAPAPIIEGWLRYTHNGCIRISTEAVRCDVIIENTLPRTVRAVFFSEQQGGIRRTAWDKFGITQAISPRQVRFNAKKIVVAETASPREGQLIFDVLPTAPLDVSVFFDNVDTNLKSFMELRLPIYSKQGLIEVIIQEPAIGVL